MERQAGLTLLDRCPGCKAVVTGGRDGCQAAWETIALRAYSAPAYDALYDLAFDAYCMQHVDQYCRSGKSYAAHLTRLCCGLEHNGDPQVYAAIRRWLDGRVELVKPEILTFRGRLTVVDLLEAADLQVYRQGIHSWAEDVWAAYASQQDTARAWIRQAVR